MNCPFCKAMVVAGVARVIDSRPGGERTIKRRRECQCRRRFSTLEIVVPNGQYPRDVEAFLDRLKYGIDEQQLIDELQGTA